ncbi:MAG: UDP-N-acetylglucosamine--N-acetylmuramyl-(pentapeptide) pyrophosphoryl-undecaprenol N-acetylglucosamine transferase [Oscillospiraceae bacterium]|nr:UDP-N-acetylglucosamine--N-acetylmuramyl-(pentapeptide) pyrophosphoryl-undecaprenol N-acetylglucosamine transferase [Oscillospiraceae bacterium]
MKFLITCAGTAGHINPALAIAGKLKELMPGSEFLFVGSGREMENRLIPMEGYKIVNIKSSGFQRKLSAENIVRNVKAAANIVIGSAQAKKLIREFKPDAAIGTGGYVCYPVLSAAAKMGIPTFIHESNAIPGLTTKLLQSTVDKIMVAFPGLEKYYQDPSRVVFTGTPVRGGFDTFTKEQARGKVGIWDKPLVVSFWGSLGASRLTQATAEFIALNNEVGAFRHIHATGGGVAGMESMRKALSDLGVNPDELKYTELRQYIDDMPVVMTASDMVMCRSGASTMGELTAIGMPSLLIPSPYVADNHQEKNARTLESAGGAVVVTEAECTGKLLFDKVSALVGDIDALDKMSAAVKAMGVPDCASKIADIILEKI